MPSWEDQSERYLAEYRGETVYDMGAGASPLPLEGEVDNHTHVCPCCKRDWTCTNGTVADDCPIFGRIALQVCDECDAESEG